MLLLTTAHAHDWLLVLVLEVELNLSNAVVNSLQNVPEFPIDADVLDVHLGVVPRGDKFVEVNGVFARIEDQR